MKKIQRWLFDNKEWVFSGFGVVALTFLASFLNPKNSDSTQPLKTGNGEALVQPQKAPSDYKRLQIQILDKTTNEPVKEVFILITSGAPIKSDMTNSHGYAEFRIPTQSTRVTVSLTKEGYAKGDYDFDLEGDENQTPRRYLTPLPESNPAPIPEPETSAPTPQTSVPAPVAPEPAPVAPESVPIAPEPVPIAPEPVPIAPEPEPVVPEPSNDSSLSPYSNLAQFEIDIFFLSGRNDLELVAANVESSLREYSPGIRIRPLNVSEYQSMRPGYSFSIRYESDESVEAGEIKRILKQKMPQEYFEEIYLRRNAVPGGTPEYISIFLDDSTTVEAVKRGYL